MRTPIIEKPATLSLFDVPIDRINQLILTEEEGKGLNWIDMVFGKSQRMIRGINEVTTGQRSTKQGGSPSRLVRFPAVLKGSGKDYVNLLPREDFGNFLYWDLAKEYKIEEHTRQRSVIETGFGIVIFLNLNKILAKSEHRNLEMLKEEVLDFFQTMRIQNARIRITGITEDAQQIYSGYNISEVEDQFLMHPFAAMRINGEMRWERWC